MAGLREQKKKETRAAIMEAALALFGERGYENTSISTLAKTAGIGKGTVYSYFSLQERDPARLLRGRAGLPPP